MLCVSKFYFNLIIIKILLSININILFNLWKPKILKKKKLITVKVINGTSEFNIEKGIACVNLVNKIYLC